MQQNVTPRGGTSRITKDKATKGERDKIRAWGRENRFDVGRMGIIAKEVVDAYHAAQNGTREETQHA